MIRKEGSPRPHSLITARLHRAALATGLVAGALGLSLPERGHSYNLSGDVLDLSQRHYRILANFTDPEANDNLTPDPDFPGSIGAELSIRKGVAEWGSCAHGTGQSDPTQACLGSGEANFDSLYSGRATIAGGPNGNIISVIQVPASILAFTEIPSTDGWRIRFYDAPRTWNDGPGFLLDGDDPMDIQGIACHEYGHALGLQHSAEPEATMFAGIPTDDAISHRSLHPDDIAGIQAIYGPRATDKPRITGASWSGPQLVLEGENFHPSNNELWFTQGQVPASRKPLRRGGIASSNGGTTLTVTPPPGAGPGDVLVRRPGFGPSDLSNAWPFDPGTDFGWSPPESYGSPGATSAGSFVLAWEALPSASVGTARVRWEGAAPLAPVIVFGGLSEQAAPLPLGTLLVARPLVRLASGTSDADGRGDVQVPLAGAQGTPWRLQAWTLDAGVPAGAALSNGLRMTLLP